METRDPGIQDKVSLLYISLFGRAPDAEGFEHWTTVLESLMLFTGDEALSIKRIVDGMSESSEYEAIYQDLTPEQQVNLLYQNLFSRDADPEGLAFWSGKIVTGQIPFTDVAYLISALAFGGGAGIDPNDTALLRNKVDVSTYLADSLWLGTNDGQVIQNAFKYVTTDPASVRTAREALFRQLNPVEEPEVVETPVDDSPAPDPVVTPSPQNVSLTDGVDTLSGSLDGAIVSGVIAQSPNGTFQTGDSISNYSRVNVDIENTTPVVAPTLSNVGHLEFEFVNTSGGTVTVDAENWTSVGQSWIANNDSVPNAVTILDGLLTTVYGVKDSSKETMYNIGIRSSSITGSNDTLQVTLSNAGSLNDETYINSQSAVEILTIDTTGTNHVILNDFSSQVPTQGSIGTVTVTGSGINSFDVGADSSNVLRLPVLATFDFSQATANNTLSVGNVVTNNLSITGGQGNDSLEGGAGNDTITGGAGADEINAGAGNNEITDAGVGEDVITHDAAGSTVDITVTDSDNVSLTAREAGATVTIAGTDPTTNRNINASLSSASVTINGTALTTGVGSYVGGTVADTITGGGGDDFLFGMGGADSLTGGAGNDTFVFNPGDSTSAEKDSITDFGDGADSIGIYDDSGSLTGIDLTSDLSGVSGLADNATSTLTVVQDGSTNTVISITNGSGASLTIDKSNVAIDVTLANGGNRIAVGGDLNDIIRGGDGDDTITGGAGADDLTGGAGDDELTGGAGIDTFNVNAGTDTITDLGVGGSDGLVVTAGATVNATVGQDWIAYRDNTSTYRATSNTGGTATLTTNDFDVNLSRVIAGDSGFTIDAAASSGAVTLFGSNFADTITGGAGNDTIGGSGGADVLTGGAGADTFAYNNFGEAETGDVDTGVIDVITDFTTGTDRIGNFFVAGVDEFSTTADGNEYADYAEALAGANVAIDTTGHDYVLSAYGAGSNWTAVVFIDIGAIGGTGEAAGAIQLGQIGAYATEVAALAAADVGDFIASY